MLLRGTEPVFVYSFHVAICIIQIQPPLEVYSRGCSWILRTKTQSALLSTSSTNPGPNAEASRGEGRQNDNF